MPYPGTCELCGRSHIEVTRHHLIPRTRHTNKRNKKVFEREEVRTRVAWLCRACHSFAHSVLTEKQMEQDYNTIGRLLDHPDIRKFVTWVRTKPPGLRVAVR